MRVKLLKPVLFNGEGRQRGTIIESNLTAHIEQFKALCKVGYAAETTEKANITIDGNKPQGEPPKDVSGKPPTDAGPTLEDEVRALLKGKVDDILPKLQDFSKEALELAQKIEREHSNRKSVLEEIELLLDNAE